MISEEKKISISKRRIDTAESYNSALPKVNDDYVGVIEKMVFYSAGIISLSITFLGYLLNKDINSLLTTEIIFCFPNYFFLYFSWLCFIVVICSGIYVKYFNAKYFFHMLSEDVMDSCKEYEESILNLDSNKSEVATISHNIEFFSKSKGISNKKKETSSFIKKLITAIVFTLFPLGIIFLAGFAMFTTNLLIKM